jgi:hypothetical protein
MSGLTGELPTHSFSFRFFFDGLPFETFSVFSFVIFPLFTIVAAVLEVPGVIISSALHLTRHKYISKPYAETKSG